MDYQNSLTFPHKAYTSNHNRLLPGDSHTINITSTRNVNAYNGTTAAEATITTSTTMTYTPDNTDNTATTAINPAIYFGFHYNYTAVIVVFIMFMVFIMMIPLMFALGVWRIW